MIQEAINYLVTLGREYAKKDQVTIAGHEMLRDPDKFKEFRPEQQIIRAFRDEHNTHLELGTIESLIDFIRSHADRKCQVVIAPDGASAYFDVDQEVNESTHKVDLHMVKVPFIAVVERMELGFIKFQDWLDQHADRIKEFNTLAQAVRLFKTEEKSSITVKENGPIITLSVAASKDCEASGLPIPKEIEVTLPTGTREFMIPNTFLLRITIQHGEAQFTLTKKEQDGSWEKLIEEAVKMLKEAELPNALILEGAPDYAAACKKQRDQYSDRRSY